MKVIFVKTFKRFVNKKETAMLPRVLFLAATAYSILGATTVNQNQQMEIQRGDQVSFVLLVSDTKEKHSDWLPISDNINPENVSFATSKVINKQECFSVRYFPFAHKVLTPVSGDVSEVVDSIQISEVGSILLTVNLPNDMKRLIVQPLNKKVVFLSDVEEGNSVEKGDMVGRLCFSTKVENRFDIIDVDGPTSYGLHLGFSSSNSERVFQIIKKSHGRRLGIVKGGKIVAISKQIDSKMGALIPVWSKNSDEQKTRTGDMHRN